MPDGTMDVKVGILSVELVLEIVTMNTLSFAGLCR